MDATQVQPTRAPQAKVLWLVDRHVASFWQSDLPMQDDCQKKPPQLPWSRPDSPLRCRCPSWCLPTVNLSTSNIPTWSSLRAQGLESSVARFGQSTLDEIRRRTTWSVCWISGTVRGDSAVGVLFGQIPSRIQYSLGQKNFLLSPWATSFWRLFRGRDLWHVHGRKI